MASIQLPGVGSVEIPDFATDYTLQQVLNVLSSQEAERIQALGEINQTLVTGSNVGRAQLARDTETASNTGKMSRMQAVQHRTNLQTLNQMKAQHKEMLSAQKRATGAFAQQMPQIMRMAGSMISGKGISDALSMMPGGLGQGIALATKVVGEFADSQRRLTDVGMGLGTSIINTGEAISSFNVPLSELERIAGSNAVTLNYLNDTTMEMTEAHKDLLDKGVRPGVFAFGLISQTARDSMKEFGNFGFTVTEVNSFLAEYLETDRKRGVLAQESATSLAANFKALAQETAAYAYDTGRNRKDLMKAQIENLNRTDASTYSMMLRMKGEEGAAETFEKNLALITNEMKARYGENADSMIDAWIQAQTQGRGLEATEAGAEFMAMLGPAGAVLDQMARSGEAIDPAMFGKFHKALEQSVNSYDTQNFQLLATQHESLQTAGRMLSEARDTTAESRHQAKLRMKDGAQLLKANEAVVKVTTDLQQGMLKVTNAMVGEGGALQPALEKAIRSVGQFTTAIGQAAKGEGLAASATIGKMLMDNPWQFLGLAAGGSMLPNVNKMFPQSGVPMANQNKFAGNLAMQQLGGATVGQGGVVTRGGDQIGKLKNNIFTDPNTGLEYKYNPQNGKFTPTKGAIKSITGGTATKALKGMKGGTLSGIFSIGIAMMEGYEELQRSESQFDAQWGGADVDKNSQEYNDAVALRDQRRKDVAIKTLGKGGGGMGGSMLMGGLVGMLGGGPLMSILGTALGGYYGYKWGGEAAEQVTGQENIFTTMQESMGEHSGEYTQGKQLAQEQQKAINMEKAKSDPSYLKLEEIRTLLTDHGAKLDVIKNASASSAVDIKKNSTSSSSALGHPSTR